MNEISPGGGTASTGPEWVQCDRCKKWRKLPSHVNSSSLPDTWFCEMNNWAPKYASCSVPQEEEEHRAVPTTSGPRIIIKPMTSNGSAILKTASIGATIANGVGNAAPTFQQEEKRYRFDDQTSGGASDATGSLKALAHTLQSTIELVANFSGNGDEDALFGKLNEIVMRLEKVSKSTTKPQPTGEEILKCPIPRELLEFLDRPDGQNNPSLYTESILRGVLVEQGRMEEATKMYEKLLADMGESDETDIL